MGKDLDRIGDGIFTGCHISEKGILGSIGAGVQ
jgi:hypothetical protein